ncbi:MAG: hypothetical protein AAF657_38090 [Acidobacteriota bacterium]
MTTKRWILVISVALLAVIGHFHYHYSTRARPYSPWDGSQVSGLLANANFPAAVWVPYPHQNLPHLREAAGVGSLSARAIARLAGLPSPTLPTFGPLALPPSSEIAVASDESGERFVVLAQVYPGFATFARLAGKLASNPWLSGGEIVVEGQTADVSWHGNQWRVISAGLSPDLLGATFEPDEATTEGGLGWIRIRQAVDPLPAGLYRLWDDRGDLRISSRNEPRGEGAPHPLETPLSQHLAEIEVFLMAFSGRHEALAEPAQALAFFEQPGPGQELPRIASLHEPGDNRWSLPGESLLEIAGRKPRTAQVDEWSIAALDSASLEQARRIAPQLRSLVENRLAWGLWLDFGGGLAEVQRIVSMFENVPIAPRRQVERWSDARLVLTPLAERFAYLQAVVAEEPRSFELILAAQRSD